jgi:outer membrane protein
MGPGGTDKTIKFGTSDKVSVDAKLQMPIFTWGRVSSTINLAKVGLTISDVLKRQEMLNVTDQVLRAFYAVVLNREIISVHESSIQRAENYLQIAEKRFSTGNVSKLDLLRAQVQLKNTGSALAEAKDNLAKSKIYLSKVVGSKDTVMNIAGSMNHEPVEEKDEELISKAESVRSDLNILQAQLDMNEMGIRIARSGNKPSLYAFSGYSVQNGFNPMEPEKFVENWNAGVQLSIPLFDGFSTKHKVEEARIELQKTKLQKEEILDMIRIQIQQALISLHQAEEKITTQEGNIVLSREALRIAEIQYQNGIVSSLELMDAQQALTQSELLYTQAVFNHVMSKLELCKAVGDYHWFEFSLQENK